MKLSSKILVAASAVFGVMGMIVDSINEEKMIKEAVDERFNELSSKQETEAE